MNPVLGIWKDIIIEEWNEFWPTFLHYDHLPESNQNLITEKMTNFYFKNGRYNGTQDKEFQHLFADAFFNVGFVKNLEFRLNYGRCANNTFVYLFSHKGSASFYEVNTDDYKTFKGTDHEDDLLYIFPLQKSSSRLFSSIPTEEDRKLSKAMVEMRVNFASTG